MDRRYFIKLSAIGAAGLSSCSFWDKPSTSKISFPIEIDDNMKIGHIVRDPSFQPKPVSVVDMETIIVGGGIAGLAAANTLEGSSFRVLELNAYPGGNSSAVKIGENYFSQGAHYDLSYPEYFGEDSLQLLQKIGIIKEESEKGYFNFVDDQYIIASDIESTCYTPNGSRPDPIPNSLNARDFKDLLKVYVGKMKMPTRIIDDELWALNEISFYQFLDKYLLLDPELLQAIDYQMIDDYGADASSVSAIAGIHYYTCRDYFSENEPSTFSPPEGNFYFVQKLLNQIAPKNIECNQLVFNIEKKDQHYFVDAFDTVKKETIRYQTKNVIYTGQKHALKFVYPKAYPIYSNVQYSSWIVVNLKLNDAPFEEKFWQNDIIGVEKELLGFVNAEAQKGKEKVLTMYLCYSPERRKEVAEKTEAPEQFIQQCLGFIEETYNISLHKFIEKAFVKKIGHAMPIPSVGYLSKNKNDNWDEPRFRFAGTDDGHLPLMMEALDSGIQAAKELNTLDR